VFSTKEQNKKQKMSASNRLYSGDVRSAIEALQLHHKALLAEAQVQRQLSDQWPDEEWNEKCLEAQAKKVGDLLTQYHESVSKTEAILLQSWANSNDKDIAHIGHSLQAGDWASLAI
jgi:hypothetical protein